MAHSDLYHGVAPLLKYFIGSRQSVKLYFAAGSVVDFTGDAIVNAANEGCLGGGGVDGAIDARGGREIHKARRTLPEISPGVRCKTGDAVTTIAGELAAKFVIHAVGPSYGYSNHEAKDQLLTSAYQNALVRAEESSCESVGFSLLSSGIFRGSRSLESVLDIGINAIVDFFSDNHDSCVKEVFLVGFTSEEKRTLTKLGKRHFENTNNSES